MIGRKVPGAGNLQAEVMFVGEGPGKVEDQLGEPFVGPTGAELDGLLRRCVGLRRSDVYLTNIVKFRTDDNDRDPEQHEINRDKPDFYAELNVIKPRIIVAVGKVSAQFLLGPVNMEKVHGLVYDPIDPVAKQIGAKVIPVYHPAAAMRLPDRYAYPMYWDFQQVGKLLRGEIEPYPPTDEHPCPVYEYVSGWDWSNLPPQKLVGVDTEGWEDDPFSVQFSFKPGTGYIILADNKRDLDGFNWWLHNGGSSVALHNDLHDRPILRVMGIELEGLKIEETMIQAHQLNNVHSRSLKTNGYRLNGMEMGSYSALTHDAEIEVVHNYLENIWQKKVCNSCLGTGKGPSRNVIDATCDLCVGLGRVSGARTGATKWCSCRKVSDKCEFCVDGAMMSAPPLIFDQETGKQKKPWSMARRIRGMLKKSRVGSVEPDLFVVEENVTEEDSTVHQLAGITVIDATEVEDKGESSLRKSFNDILPEIKASTLVEFGPIPRTTLKHVKDKDAVKVYAARDPDATLRNHLKMRPQLTALGLDRVYELDCAILPMLDKMRSNGVLINRGYFEQLHIDFQAELIQKSDELSELVGYKINPASPDQVSELLYGKLDIKPQKFSKKTGKPSTDEKTLESIKIKHAFDDRLAPIINGVLDCREIIKMDSTYVLAALEIAGKDDRIRCDILYTNTPTGRLAARNLNMMALPVRSERGKKVAAGFIAQPGCVLVSVDMDQIEMRIGAHLSQDPTLMALFIEGQKCSVRLAKGACRCHDPHWATAARMYKTTIDKVTPAQRYPSKTINFGAFYGMAETRLMNELALQNIKISKPEAREFLNIWFETYPGVRTFLNKCYSDARTYGYVRTLLGRIRYLPGVYSSIDRIREEALRQAGNSPVQGGAADVFKSALLSLDTKTLPEINRLGMCRPLLPVHDAVVFEAEESIAPYAQQMIEWDMAHAMKLSVPLGASGAIANNLGALK